jgi:hypothetical protein
MHQSDDDIPTVCVTRHHCMLLVPHTMRTVSPGSTWLAGRTTWAGNSSAVVIVGLGLLAEFRNGATNSTGRLRHTSDRLDLEECVAAVGGSFRVTYARAATNRTNFFMVSWGLPDSSIVCYQRTVLADDAAWEAVAVFVPTDTILQSLGDGFMEEKGSASIHNIDIVRLVLEVGEILAVTAAVARLGGYV